jgi:hypothetical protein
MEPCTLVRVPLSRLRHFGVVRVLRGEILRPFGGPLRFPQGRLLRFPQGKLRAG